MKLSALKRHLWLAALFLLALPLFCWLQWQPKAWFAEQLAINGLTGKISYGEVRKSFPGLRLNGTNITLPNGKAVACDEIILRPAFSALLHGEQGLFVRAKSNGINAEAVIVMSNTQLNLGNVMVIADATKLASFDSRLLLLGLQGEIILKGHTLLEATVGLPLDGDVNLLWNKPSSTFLPTGMDNIELSLTASGALGAKAWSWQIGSQPEMIGGQGKVMSGAADIRQWQLRGNMRLSKDHPERILSGTVGAPHWQ